MFVHACVHFLTCIVGCLSALACKQKAWLIWTSYELYVLVCALFLYGHKGEVASAEAKMGYAGGGETSLLVCYGLDGGGDGWVQSGLQVSCGE